MMLWSEFLERIHAMDIPPDAEVLFVNYSFTDPANAISVETIDKLEEE